MRRQRRLVGRDEPVERQSSPGGGEMGGVDVVLQGDGDSVQRPAYLPGGALVVKPIGLPQGRRVGGEDRVDPPLVERDPRRCNSTRRRAVTRPSSIARCISGMVASTMSKGSDVTLAGDAPSPGA